MESTTRAWYGRWNGNFDTEYGRCQNGMEDFKNEMEDNLPYQFHTSCCALCLQKNTYQCQVVMNNIVTEVFNFNIYAYYLPINRGTLVVCIAQTVYVLRHSKYIAICSIDVLVDDFDLFFCFCVEIDILPSPKFCFLTSSRKLVFAISFPFQLNFMCIFSFSAYNNSFSC